ncbi:unnamed protein product [Trichogramma brassicae]|uniref:Uncharacterized protein n=1 Tax=Trichogramma brassicae TaxID=86971 RepID=A0A6H5IMC4_9HYME|nr:unnamed protein product [Trichogramma brassicae]
MCSSNKQRQPQRIRITTLLAASSGEQSNVSRTYTLHLQHPDYCVVVLYTYTSTRSRTGSVAEPEIVISTSSSGSCWYIDDPPAGRRRRRRLLACAAYRCAIRNNIASSPYDSSETPPARILYIYKSAQRTPRDIQVIVTINRCNPRLYVNVRMNVRKKLFKKAEKMREREAKSRQRAHDSVKPTAEWDLVIFFSYHTTELDGRKVLLNRTEQQQQQQQQQQLRLYKKYK